MSPKLKLRWLKAASLVVQVAIERVDAPALCPGEAGEATLTGEVRRVFRGDYACGARISFRMAVYSERPPTGDCYQDIERLRAARVIEAYLVRDVVEPRAWSALDTWLVEALSDEPLFLKELKRRVARGDPY